MHNTETRYKQLEQNITEWDEKNGTDAASDRNTVSSSVAAGYNARMEVGDTLIQNMSSTFGDANRSPMGLQVPNRHAPACC